MATLRTIFMAICLIGIARSAMLGGGEDGGVLPALSIFELNAAFDPPCLQKLYEDAYAFVTQAQPYFDVPDVMQRNANFLVQYAALYSIYNSASQIHSSMEVYGKAQITTECQSKTANEDSPSMSMLATDPNTTTPASAPTGPSDVPDPSADTTTPTSAPTDQSGVPDPSAASLTATPTPNPSVDSLTAAPGSGLGDTAPSVKGGTTPSVKSGTAPSGNGGAATQSEPGYSAEP